jgi:hypothetical protein
MPRAAARSRCGWRLARAAGASSANSSPRAWYWAWQEESLGVVLARWAVLGLLALAPLDLSRNIAIAVDYRIVLFAVGVPMLTGILFGLAPALWLRAPI